MASFQSPLWAVITLCLVAHHAILSTASITLDISSADSIKSVSRQLADSTMKYYVGNKTGQTPGLLPSAGQFQWWIGGALFGQIIEYWFLTGDSTYNDVATQAILFQTGPDNDFEPTNQTRTEGNDDQAFWAFAAMTAAELKFPDPPKESPQWLALAQAVFNRQAERWDTDNCGGGLRWQFNPLNNGYNLKNTVSNGCFFLLASRLARYTQNDTYAQWANKTYDWMQSTGLIDSNSAAVYDSISFSPGVCPNSPIGKIEWTYNMGAMIGGSAFMWNKTQDETWKTRINNFLTHTQQTFFSEKYGGGKIMAEYACEPQGNCNADQRSFKAYLARWLALTAQLAPFTQTQIVPWLQNSAEGAAKVCDGDGANTVCGRTWYADSNDGTIDVGNQITAMSIVQSNLILNVAAPVDQSGGTSQGNPSAGGGKDENNVPDIALRRITTADKAGAWILTTVALGLMAFAVLFIVVDGDISTMFSDLHRSSYIGHLSR